MVGVIETGHCVSWIKDRGFGFIRSDETGRDVFVLPCVHGSAVPGVVAWNKGQFSTGGGA